MVQKDDKEIRPFGLWPSPVTPAVLSTSLRFSDVQWDSDGRTLVWLEGRSDRGVLVSREAPGAMRDLTDEHSVRGGVGYGGGDFTVSGGIVVFAERSGRLFRRTLGYDRPTPITPAFGSPASPAISPDGSWVVYVHSYERKDVLALAALDGSTWPGVLAQGADFYMQPVWHPDSKQLAWVEWNHPNMPWDGTLLKLGRIEGETPLIADQQMIDGGKEMPVFQPAFSPDGRWLSYIVQDGEWDSLVLYDLQTHQKRTLLQNDHLIQPAWVQGIRTYGWTADSQAIFIVRSKEGFQTLLRVEVGSGKEAVIPLPEYTVISQIAVSPTEEKVAIVASGPVVPVRVVVWDAKNGAVVQRRSMSESIDPEDLSVPRSISWQSEDGTPVYGVYFPPANRRYTATGLPPAIIYIHGGPTSQSLPNFSADADFFTSRGYAYLAVNYRGSTGYGRSYMLALRQRWGDLDVVDAIGGAKALVDQGLADPAKLVIKGGSAGGYTVLNALVRYPGHFKAGLCSFGVSNLFTLAMDTHKFEERYNDSMVGTLPEAAGRYHAWSPIFFADRIRDPLAVFQGSEDNVVPPDQSESIVAQLRANHVPHIYRLYEGEGHGFRKTETIAAFYQDLERFLMQHVLFVP